MNSGGMGREKSDEKINTGRRNKRREDGRENEVDDKQEKKKKTYT